MVNKALTYSDQPECRSVERLNVADNNHQTSRFAGTLMDVLDKVSYRRVPFDEQFDPVYRLRYQAYLREGFIAPNATRVVYDEHDLAPNVYCFGVYIDKELVSSIRFHHVTPGQRTSPSRTVFPETLGKMLDEGISYIDPSRFTADHEATLAYPALPYLTLRIVAMASEYFDVDYCVSSVRREHAAFYVRVFGSKRLPGLGYYEGIDFPMHLYAAKLSAIRDRVARRFPFFMSTAAERAQIFGKADSGDAPAHIRPTARQAQTDDNEVARSSLQKDKLSRPKRGETDSPEN
jgi:N-acyl amino acid synthase FeeM